MSPTLFAWLNLLSVPTVALCTAAVGMLWRINVQLGGLQAVQMQHEIRISNLERKVG